MRPKWARHGCWYPQSRVLSDGQGDAEAQAKLLALSGLSREIQEKGKGDKRATAFSFFPLQFSIPKDD